MWSISMTIYYNTHFILYKILFNILDYYPIQETTICNDNNNNEDNSSNNVSKDDDKNNQETDKHKSNSYFRNTHLLNPQEECYLAGSSSKDEDQFKVFQT